MEDAGPIDRKIEGHYTRANLEAAILSALGRAGKDPQNLRAEDLLPLDEFHVRGREATVELAKLLNLDSAKRVLDVGSGIGGPSRYLAAAFGCHVTGLDLIEEYVRVASMLAERTGLGGRVDYRHGNALAMPFDDGSFDIVWTQHVAMNIPNKPKLYAEMRRVLKPGGLLAIYDVLGGPGGTPLFPVPWAREPSISFLITPDEMRRLLEATGFEIVRWRDTTAAGRDWFQKAVEKIREGGPPPLGFHLLLGPDFPIMAENQRRNLEEHRILLIEIVAQRF